MEEVELKALKSTRSRIKGQITQMKTFVRNFDINSGKLSDIQVRDEKLEQYYNTFVNIQDQIDLLSTDLEDASLAEFENNYYDLKSTIKTILDQKKYNLVLPNLNSNNSQSQELNLLNIPKLNLPQFDGKIENWVSFFDFFEATVHNNVNLSDIQKFYYLKSSLKGEPLEMLSSLPLTQANYSIALNLLKERFSNIKVLVNTHLKALFSLPNATDVGSLKHLLDITNVNVRALNHLGYKTEEWDVILVYLLTSKLDTDLRTKWELSNNSKEVATFQKLEQFLSQYIQALQACKSSDQRVKSNPHFSKPVHVKSNITGVLNSTTQCPVCSQMHELFKCKEFLSFKPSDRFQEVKKLQRCFNCLSNTHMANNCRASKCKICSKPHNTLLHIVQDKSIQVASQPQNTQTIQNITQHAEQFGKAQNISSINTKTTSNSISPKVLSTGMCSTTKVLLSTAMIKVKDAQGEFQTFRSLIDPGSEGSFISEACFQKLGLTKQPYNVSVHGVGNSYAGYTRGITELIIKTKLDDIQVKAYIMKKLTNVSSISFLSIQWNHISNLDLADPYFYKSGKVDIILGADIYVSLLEDGIVKGMPGTPSAINSKLGYLLSGEVSCSTLNQINSFRIAVDENNINTTLERFWQIEEVNHEEPKLPGNEFDICEEHFLSTHSRDPSGKFCVRLPTKPSISQLGDSLNTAVNRFLRLESSLTGSKRDRYHAFIKEYIELNHMQPTAVNNISGCDTNCSYYLPHHAVYRESNSTTKIRVVFDASCKTSSGTSLNDHLHIGPKLQTDITNLLIRFRLYKIVFTADIEKFYRQILISKNDQVYQRILWRTSPNDPIQSYDLLTVTYGTAPAPFLAIRCLHELSNIIKKQYPEVARILKEDFYVDDLVSGTNSIEQAIKVKHELTGVLKEAGFPLRKWSSNAKEILNEAEAKPSQDVIQFQDKDSFIKLLGLLWDSNKDIYRYSINLSDLPTIITKRFILSEIARLFDPLGLLCPIVTKAKIIMQKTWLCKNSWDDQLPQDLINEFIQYRDQLSFIKELQIPRAAILFDSECTYELIGFCDASEKAYAAALYLRSVSPSQVLVTLICAKSRVCPLKKVTIPRLELCGAQLLAQLIAKIRPILSVENTYLFTDSTIVLAWLAKDPSTWKTFVSSRVSEIQKLTKISNWNHVKSEDNPADIASKGVYGYKFISQDMWWSGPSWLSHTNLPIAKNKIYNNDTILERRHIKCSLVTQDIIDELWYTKYSSFTRLINVTAYCLRFMNNINNVKIIGPLTSNELKLAQFCIIKHIQKITFDDDIRSLHNKNSVKRNSKLASLNPLIDEKGILRVGGRLQNSKQHLNKIHQIILPVKHQFIYCLITHIHEKYFHAGIQFIMNTLRQRFWLIGNVRSAVRKVIGKCSTCYRFSGKPCDPIMGNLPESRVTFTRCFLHCGCDYAGPYLTKQVGSRSKVLRKSYLVVFVCMAVKAVHLELVSDLTSEAFIATLNRFISRRGTPLHMHSDNGTNFVGANNSLKKFFEENNNHIISYAAQRGIEWHFIPPNAPHMGGLWESAVKSAKFHLKRVIGDHILSFEELNTLIIQVEAILNSRPLCRMSDDQTENDILTPGHFLIGTALTSLPEQDIHDKQTNYIKRWQLVLKLRRDFWNRWHKEYLNSLQQRHKWKFQNSSIKIGDVVLIKEDNLPPMKYAMGIIYQIFPGQDNVIRVVEIKTTKGIIKRPMTKILKLPIN